MADKDALGKAGTLQGNSSTPVMNTAGQGIPSSDESVEDILSGIIGGDGSFKDDFNGLYARYLGAGSDAPLSADATVGAGISMPDIGQHIEYEAPKAVFRTETKKTESVAAAKMPQESRIIYDAAEQEARRPEFSSDGTVRYPAMGSGAAEERVVYDAEWEEKAKKEAARRENMRRDSMLKGDSTYVRGFVSGGVPMANRGSTAVKKPAVNPAYIDPLSDDEPVLSVRETAEQHKGRADATVSSSEGNSFFPDGFSAENKNNKAAGGKTEIISGSNITPDSVKTENSNAGANSAAISEPKSKAIDAFAKSQESEEAFRARWKEQIEQAERRKREKEKAQREQAQRERAEKEKLAAAAKITESDSVSLPLDIEGIQVSTDTIAAAAAVYAEKAEAEKTHTVKAPAESEQKGFEFNFDEPVLPAPEKLEKPAHGTYRSRSGKARDTKLRKTPMQKASFYLKTHFSTEGFKAFVKKTFPSKGDNGKEIVRKCISVIAFVALLAALVYLIVYFFNYRERIKQQNEGFDELTSYSDLSSAELEAAWNNIHAQYPDVVFPEGMNINFANLYATSQDVVGYLSINNTNIKTVLTQTNNDSYYLYKDIYGDYSRYGNPFVNCHCDMSISGPGKNTIIYGHNTHDGLMFHQLERYMTVDGYLNAPIITLDTLFNQTKWVIFAVVLRNSTPEADNGVVSNYFHSSYSSNEAFMADVKAINERSMIHTGVDVVSTDKMITLYTCYQSLFDGGRLVVFGRQLRDGESEQIDASKVYFNSNAKFPQAYYDKRGLTNPYYTAPVTTVPQAEASSESSSQSQSEVTTIMGENEITEATTENIEVPF